VLECGNLAITLPKFDVLAVDVLFCVLNRGGIVGAIYRNCLVGAAVGVHGVHLVLSRRTVNEVDV